MKRRWLFVGLRLLIIGLAISFGVSPSKTPKELIFFMAYGIVVGVDAALSFK